VFQNDLTGNSCSDLVKIIGRLVPTRGTKLVDVREAGRVEASALDMLSSHMALLPERARFLTRPAGTTGRPNPDAPVALRTAELPQQSRATWKEHHERQ